MTTHPITCPNCGLAEPVQKVSVLYQSNTKEWTETRSDASGDFRTVTRQAKTLLGKKLSPPPQPVAGWNMFLVFSAIIAFIAIMVFIAIIPIAIGFGTPLILLAIPTLWAEQPTSIPAWTKITGATCLGIACLIPLAALVWGSIKWKAHYAKSVETHKQQVAEAQALQPRWERACQRWEQLYHCGQDDIVFIPGENRTAPSDQMLSYLYEQD